MDMLVYVERKEEKYRAETVVMIGTNQVGD